MKIAYLLIWYEGPDSGVGKKVQDQLAAWRNLGHETKLFIITSKSQHDDWVNCLGVECVLVEHTKFDKYRCRRDIIKCVRDWGPDLLYMRDAFPVGTMREFCSDVFTVIEINSDASRELRNRSLFRYFANIALRRYCYSRVHGYVFVSYELHRTAPSFMRRKPYVISGNGIEFARLPSLAPVALTEPVKLMFIGSRDHYWGGHEQIFELARLRPNLQFHIVGMNSQSKSEILPNVHFHGKIGPSEYHEIARECSIGLSTMALGKKGMSEASPLKSREYLALGLPIITRYIDTDFMNDEEFILCLPLDSLSIASDLNSIDRFLVKWHGRRVNRDEVGQISIQKKEFIKLGFFQELMEKSKTNGVQI
jgi:glycosyltransferase involved in cell wall biosynthesis